METKKQVCPECGSASIYCGRGIAINWMQSSNAANHILIAQGFIPLRAPIDVYVCTDCGYVRSFVSRRTDIEKIIETWTPLNP